MFSSDTFTPGRANNTNHTPMATVEINTSTASDTHHTPWDGNPWKPSVEYDTTSRVAPPTISCEEENTEGSKRSVRVREINTLEKAEVMLLPTRNRIPIRGVHPRKSVADTFPEAMITSPANPSRMAAALRQERRSSRRITWANTATNKGCEPTTRAPTAASTRICPM